MERDNVIEKVEEIDLEQLQQILKSVFNNNISYEKIKEQYKISRDNKDIHILGYYMNDNLIGTLTLNILKLLSGKEATIWDLYHRQCAHKLYKKLGYDENRDKAFVKQI